MHGLQKFKIKYSERERERERKRKKMPLSESIFDISSCLKHNLTNLTLNVVLMLDKFRRLLAKSKCWMHIILTFVCRYHEATSQSPSLHTPRQGNVPPGMSLASSYTVTSVRQVRQFPPAQKNYFTSKSGGEYVHLYILLITPLHYKHTQCSFLLLFNFSTTRWVERGRLFTIQGKLFCNFYEMPWAKQRKGIEYEIQINSQQYKMYDYENLSFKYSKKISLNRNIITFPVSLEKNLS